MTKIFISYKRKSSAMLATLIWKELSARKNVTVFIDYDALKKEIGDFPEMLRKEILAADVVVCLLGDATLDSPWVNEEIKQASNANKAMIPVFQEKFVQPLPPIPDHIAVLLRSNGVKVYDVSADFIDESLRKLVLMVEKIGELESRLAAAEQQLAKQSNVADATSPNDIFVRNRKVLLSKVKEFWVQGVLEKSLYEAVLIALQIEDRVDAVNPWTTMVETFDDVDQRNKKYELPSNKSVNDIFEEKGCALLILGKPGSGKTTTLLDLARTAIASATRSPSQPIPVVLNLSSWINTRQGISDWVISELSVRYQVRKEIARTWIEQDKLLLLLDGLDELKAERRSKCIRAINYFRQNFPFAAIVVGCRTDEYMAEAEHLNLNAAISVQPLTKEQIYEYLAQLGGKVATLKLLLESDEGLMELAKSPLLLSVMVLTYEGLQPTEIESLTTYKERQKHLFDSFVRRMFKRRQHTNNGKYSQPNTLHWLKWLSLEMKRQAQSIFLIEQLNVNAIPKSHQVFAKIIARSIAAFLAIVVIVIIQLSIGGLRYGVLVGVFSGLIGATIHLAITKLAAGTTDIDHSIAASMAKFLKKIGASQVSGLTAGWVGILVGWLEKAPDGASAAFLNAVGVWGIGIMVAIFIHTSIVTLIGDEKTSQLEDAVETAEAIKWSLSGAVSKLKGLGLMIFAMFAMSLVLGLLSASVSGIKAGFVSGLGSAVIFLAAYLGRGGVTGEEVTTKTFPNQGIKQSVKNTFFVSLFSAVVLGIILFTCGFILGGLEVGARVGIAAVAGAGLAAVLRYGSPAIKHISIRIMLWLTHSAPFNLTSFLNQSADWMFLQKVGGGYKFVHQMVQEYFSELEIQ